METALFDSVHKRTEREECVSNNNIGDLQKFLIVTLDDRYEIVAQESCCAVSTLQ